MDSNLPSKTNHRMRGVTHHLPHRTRYRLAIHHRTPGTVTRIQESILKVPGVKKVEFNERTGSLLVHHDENPEILPMLGTILENIAGDLFVEITEADLAFLPGVSLLAQLVKKRFGKINDYVLRKTNNYLDLKMLLPIGFVAAGIYQTSKNKAWFSQVPAWVLFYYAYDSYLKFHAPASDLAAANLHGNGHNYN